MARQELLRSPWDVGRPYAAWPILSDLHKHLLHHILCSEHACFDEVCNNTYMCRGGISRSATMVFHV
jgi:hypothetical protein